MDEIRELETENLENQPEQYESAQENKPSPDEIKEQNFRQMRQEAERQSWRAEQEIKRSRELEMELSRYKSSPVKEGDDEDFDDTDDIVIKRELKQFAKKMKEKDKIYQEEIRQIREENLRYQDLATEEALKNKYKGYATIVNDTNLDKLKNEDPILYDSIMSHTTIIGRKEAAYKILKPYLTEKKSYEETNARLEENKNKPRAAASIGGQESRANPLADYQDKKRWKPEQKFK